MLIKSNAESKNTLTDNLASCGRQQAILAQKAIGGKQPANFKSLRYKIISKL